MHRSALALIGCAVAFAGPLWPAHALTQDQPKAAEVLRAMAEYHGSVEHATFSCTVEVHMLADGTESRYWANYDGWLSRPSQFRLQQTGGMPIASLFVGPEETFILGTEHNRYVAGDGVENIADAFTQHDATWLDWQWRMVVGPGLKSVVASDPLALMEGTLDTAEFIGAEDVKGVATNRVRIMGGGVPFDLWVAADGQARLVKASYPLSEEWLSAEWLPESRGYTTHFTQWATPETIDKASFAFDRDGVDQAPNLAAAIMGPHFDDVEMDMDMGGWDDGEQADANGLQGQQAPAFELATTGGGTMSLASALEDNKVVVLDFWATWCPPCREGLPVLDQLAADHADKGVKIYAVNVQESEKVAARFMEQQELGLAVALDTEGKVSEAYQVTGIPQTVVIDGDGTIRAVHVGFSPDLKKTLSREIDASLAGEPAPEPGARRGASELPDAENVSQAWAVNGMFGSAAVDQSGRLVVAGFGGVSSLGADGERTENLGGRNLGDVVRPMRRADGEQGYAVFSRWGQPPSMVDAQGKKLWTVPRGDGPNDAWPADLDGDGVDELIVGYNGGTGIRAFDAEGKELWANRTVGNIWHATAHDLDGDGVPEPISTSAGGSVHVYDPATGRQTRLLWSRDYSTLVRPATREGEPIVLLGSGGLGGQVSSVIAVSAKGEEHWRITLPGQGPAHEIAAAASRPWGAVGFDGGLVCVFDLRDGRILARTDLGGRQPAVAWHESEGGPTLIVANGASVTALVVEVPDAR